MSLLLIRENHRSSVVLSKYSLSKKDLSLFLQNNTLEHISLSVGNPHLLLVEGCSQTRNETSKEAGRASRESQLGGLQRCKPIYSPSLTRAFVRLAALNRRK